MVVRNGGKEMKQILSIIGVLSILTLGLPVATGYTSESNLKGWDRSYQSSEVIGLWVMNHQGRYLGRVQDLVFDPDGHVIFAIIGYTRFNWRLIGENSVAAPFNALVYERHAKQPVVRVDISLEKFQSAPRFTKADLMDRQREAEVYRYFGQQPYWTEGGTAGTGSPGVEKPMTRLE
jgi:sporulation protein YlmC with PRC-barrel domain